MNRLICGIIAGMLVLTAGLAAYQPETLAAGSMIDPSGTATAVDDTTGNQTDPHISGKLVTYTSQDGLATEIRYRDVATGVGGVIPGGDGRDRLADISGNTIVFTRTLFDRSAIIAFDVSLQSLSELDAQSGSRRRDPAIGSTTVVWEDHGPVTGAFPASEIIVYDLVTGDTRRLTDDTAHDRLADVSPGGSIVVWQKCQLAPSEDCNVWQATRSDLDWTTLQLTGSGIDGQDPATDGQFVVYQSTRNGETDLFWQPAGGGPEQQLALPGDQIRPSISGGLIAFESENLDTGQPDIMVYDLNTDNLCRITETPDIFEALPDIVVDPNGLATVVYAERTDYLDVYAFSFVPVSDDTTPPVLDLPDDISVNALVPE